jgi:uncharacterized protein (TIGR02145 family)
MKNFFFYLLLFSNLISDAQTQQNINKNSDTASNLLTNIDSIRFNGSSSNMEVVLQNGTIESHSITDIINVNFASISQHSCGAESVHNPDKTYGSMTDQQGNVYKTILIGTQEWMAENLKTSIYRNGEPIETNLTDAEWANTPNTQIGAWAFYSNDSQYDCPYGKLYNWYAVADPRHLCPSGWHEPTDGEWTTLLYYLDGESVAGGKMKSTGLQYWISPNNDATNESSFSGLPGGRRANDGVFGNVGYDGYWWSSSEFAANFALYRSLNNYVGNAYQNVFLYSKLYGFSVRCLRD